MRREWELEDLIACWTLDEDELALLANKTGATRLGFALLLKYFEQEARFPRREDVPRAAVDFMAGQVKVGAELFADYDFTSRQAANHRGQVRDFHKFREGHGPGRGPAGRVAVDRHLPDGDLAGPAADSRCWHGAARCGSLRAAWAEPDRADPRHGGGAVRAGRFTTRRSRAAHARCRGPARGADCPWRGSG